MAEDVWKVALESSGEGTIDWDTSSGKLKISKEWKKLLGISDLDSFNKFSDLQKTIHPDDADRFLEELTKYLKTSGKKIFYNEYRFKSETGRYRWLLIKGKLIGSDRFVGTATDLSERKKIEEKLTFESQHDRATGAYRRDFFEKISEKIDKETKNGPRAAFSLLLIDINGLKEANDRYGHQAGDKLIYDTAQLLQNFVRIMSWRHKEDFVVRWGGDEFVILLDECSNKDARIVLERLREHVEKYNLHKVEFKQIKFSVGVGSSDLFSKNTTVGQVLGMADEEIYLEKLSRIEHNRSGIIRYLLDRLSEKDYVDSGHIKRLRAMAKIFSGILQDKGEMTLYQGIYLDLLCLLHDMGKVELDDRILNKTGKLTVEEKKILESHTVLGQEVALLVAQALNVKVDLSTFPKLILSHHEYWNGRGYPKGIKGRKIPIEDRVFSILDAYDSMTNKRPYREKISTLKALEEIRDQADKQFDPELVDVFIENKIYSHV